MDISDKTEEEHLKIISKNFKNIKFVPNNLRKDKNFILKVIENMNDSYGRIFSYIPRYLNDDEDIGLALVKKSGRTLECLSERLCSNKEIVFTAVKEYAFSILHASKEFKDNKELALIAVSKEPKTLGCVSDRLKDDDDVVLLAIQKDGIALSFASKRFRSHKEFVLIALNRSKHVMQYVDDNLKSDKEIALTALKKDQLSYLYFSKQLEKELKGLDQNQRIKYLESAILKDKLNKELDSNPTKNKKIKI